MHDAASSYYGWVLYLDFDGVLHPEDVWRRPKFGPYVATPPGHTLFEDASLLVALLNPYKSDGGTKPPLYGAFRAGRVWQLPQFLLMLTPTQVRNAAIDETNHDVCYQPAALRSPAKSWRSRA